MIIVEVMGGLGNQMYQFALYKELQYLNKDVKLDIFSYDNDSKREFELTNFNVDINYATVRDIMKYGKKCSRVDNIFDKVLFELVYRKKNLVYSEENVQKYQPEIFEFDNVYLSGYWQNSLYFNDVVCSLRQCFKFPNNMSTICRKVAEAIINSNSVSIHVRRSDYLDNEGRYGNICTLQYYKCAIDYIKKRTENPHFFVFSDDIQWIRNNFIGRDFTIVDCNSKQDSFWDMYLISICKNNIIANSSFSWWGAWLNSNPDKIVCAPEKWFNISNGDKPWIQSSFIKIGAGKS